MTLSIRGGAKKTEKKCITEIKPFCLVSNYERAVRILIQLVEKFKSGRLIFIRYWIFCNFVASKTGLKCTIKNKAV